MALIICLLPLTVVMPTSKQASSNPSVRFLQIGLGGSIESDVLTADLTGDGEIETLLGTSKGLYIISQGNLLNYIPTSSSVTDVALLDDVTGDGRQEVVLAVADTSFPNIRCYHGATGEKVWQFVPKQEVFLQNLMWTEQQMLTFDIETTDVNSDNFEDVVATSGYCAYAIDGRTGTEIWRFETGNNLWKVAVVPDLDDDGASDLAIGGQDGYLYVLSGKDGVPLWQRRIVEKCNVTNEKGKLWAVVDRSVWDIIPLNVRDKPKTVVSSEDGKVRLIDLRDGSVEWEVLLIEYVDALLFKYYQQKWKQPTGPWDENFFNLEVSLAPDVTGDGIEEVLASVYTGRRRVTGQETKRSGLFLINAVSGRTLWKNTGLSLEHVARVEATLLGGEKVLLLPSGKSGYTDQVEVIDLEDGTTVKTIVIESGQETFSGDEYSVKQFGDNSFLLVSDLGDLLCVSPSGEVLWDYPRITQVAVERGDFTGDEIQDLLIISRSFHRGDMFRPTARVLYVIDGSTREKAWSYEMPHEEFVATGGISSIVITPDISGDGKQDIAGFIQPPQVGGEMVTGEHSRVLLLSGKDGAILLKQQVVEQTYYGIWEGLYKNSSLIVQKLREYFEMELERDLPTEFERQSQERREQFEQELEQELNQRRQEGASEQELATLEQERRQQLVQELKKMREDMEKHWREHFEEVNLPEQLDEWRRRLDDEEEGHMINKWICSLDVMRNRNVKGGMAFVMGTPNDIFIIDHEGKLLWNRTYDPWAYADPFTGVDHEEMRFDLIAGDTWEVCYQTAGDLNGDGIDDLVAFTQRKIVIGLSKLTNGELDFSVEQIIELEKGVDPRQAKLVSDLDGDGVDEIFYMWSQENQPPVGVFVSPATGKRLLEIEDCDPEAATIDLACGDLDGDGYADMLVFRRWGEKRCLEVRSGRAGNTIWESDSYDEDRLFQNMNYRGSIMPGAPISDISGDGVPDLALVSSLTYQPGAQVVLYDVVGDNVVKEIVLEEVDTTRQGRQHKHPGLAVSELGDFNGDGSKELAVSTALGDTEEKKEFRLLIVDIWNEEVIADFQILASAFIDLGSRSEFGAVGLSGEVYFLDVASNLMITSPAAGATETSPLRIEWTGVAAGSFNQVFIDGVEVGRTNENEFTVPVAEGEHVLTVRSVDEYGRGAYQTVDFVVQKKSSAAALAITSLVALAVIAVSPSATRYISLYRRRKRHG